MPLGLRDRIYYPQDPNLDPDEPFSSLIRGVTHTQLNKQTLVVFLPRCSTGLQTKKNHQNAHTGQKPRWCWCNSWQKHKEGLGAWGLVEELTAGMGWLF